MNSLERLAEASALLRTVEQSQELTVAQRDACTHIRGLVDVLASSIETLQEMDSQPLRTDGGVLNVQIKDAGEQTIVESALDELAEEEGMTISRSRGPSGIDEMTRSDAMVELCKRYLQDDLPDVDGVDVMIFEDDDVVTDGGTTPKYKTEGPSTGWSPGDRAADVDQDDRPGLLVVESTNIRADEYVVYESANGSQETVHGYHRGQYPADDDVVRVVFEESLDKYLQAVDRDLRVTKVLDVLRALQTDQIEHENGARLAVYAYPESRLGREPDAE